MNSIGIKKEAAKELAVSMNELLANYQVFQMNVRGFHWNIKGDKFFELHAKFEELYDDLVIKIDEIAERILTLQEVPIHTFEEYLTVSTITPEKDISIGKTCIESILKSFNTLLVRQRSLLSLSEKGNDEGTNALMSDYIREQEKLVWMFSAYQQ